jgi:hypothetical protein
MPIHPDRPMLRLLVNLLLSLVIVVVLAGVPGPAAADGQPSGEQFVCEGDPLLAIANNGAVDATDIPNQSAGTVPGAFMVLHWRDVTLQLPRTNNAGAPSYSDGRWWWSAEDPNHPIFEQRRGDVEQFACERLP